MSVPYIKTQHQHKRKSLSRVQDEYFIPAAFFKGRHQILTSQPALRRTCQAQRNNRFLNRFSQKEGKYPTDWFVFFFFRAALKQRLICQFYSSVWGLCPDNSHIPAGGISVWTSDFLWGFLEFILVCLKGVQLKRIQVRRGGSGSIRALFSKGQFVCEAGAETQKLWNQRIELFWRNVASQSVYLQQRACTEEDKATVYVEPNLFFKLTISFSPLWRQTAVCRRSHIRCKNEIICFVRTCSKSSSFCRIQTWGGVFQEGRLAEKWRHLSELPVLMFPCSFTVRAFRLCIYFKI